MYSKRVGMTDQSQALLINQQVNSAFDMKSKFTYYEQINQATQHLNMSRKEKDKYEEFKRILKDSKDKKQTRAESPKTDQFAQLSAKHEEEKRHLLHENAVLGTRLTESMRQIQELKQQLVQKSKVVVQLQNQLSDSNKLNFSKYKQGLTMPAFNYDQQRSQLLIRSLEEKVSVLENAKASLVRTVRSLQEENTIALERLKEAQSQIEEGKILFESMEEIKTVSQVLRQQRQQIEHLLEQQANQEHMFWRELSLKHNFDQPCEGSFFQKVSTLLDKIRDREKQQWTLVVRQKEQESRKMKLELEAVAKLRLEQANEHRNKLDELQRKWRTKLDQQSEVFQKKSKESDVHKLNRQLENIRHKLIDLEDERVRLKNKLDSSNQRISQLELSVESKSSELDLALSKLSEKQSRLRLLTEELNEERKLNENELDVMNEELVTLREERVMISRAAEDRVRVVKQRVLQELMAKLEKLKQGQKAESLIENYLDQLLNNTVKESVLSKEKDKVRQLKEQNANLLAVLKQSESKKDKGKKDRKEDKAKLTKSTSSQYFKIKQDLVIASLEQEKDRLLQLVQRQQEQNQANLTKLQRLSQKLEQKASQVAQMKKQASVLKSNYEAQLDKYLLTINQMKLSEMRKDQELEGKMKSSQQIEQVISKQRRLRLKAQRQKQQIESNYHSAVSRLKQLQSNYKQMEQDHERLDKEVGSLKAKLGSAKALQHSVNTNISNYQQTRKQLKQAEEKLAATSKELRKTKEELSRKDQTLKQFKKKLESSRLQSEMQNQEIAHKLQKLIQNQKKLKEEKAKLTSEVRRYRQEEQFQEELLTNSANILLAELGRRGRGRQIPSKLEGAEVLGLEEQQLGQFLDRPGYMEVSRLVQDRRVAQAIHKGLRLVLQSTDN